MGRMSNETRQALIEEYKRGEKTTTEIAKMLGICRSTITNIINQEGLEQRKPRKGKKESDAKACPRCRKLVNVNGAKFCPFCGADIRTENELLAEKLLGLGRLHAFIPEAERDNFMQTISEAAAKLRKIK